MRKSRKQIETPTSGPAVRSRAQTVWTLLAIVTLFTSVWAVYGRALDAPFIFDDTDSVFRNSSIVRLWPLWRNADERGPLNPPPYSAMAGRPLVNLSLALNYHFGKYQPRGYHVVNVTVHILSALLVWGILRRTLRLDYFHGRFARLADPLALAAALLWALHPLVTEAVIYITQRTELFMAFFYLATLYCSLRYLDAGLQSTPRNVWPRTAWLVLAILACVAGMATKEVMVSAPLVVFLFDRTFIAGTAREAARRSWPLYLGLSCCWLLLVALNFGGPRSDSAGFHLGVPILDWWFNQATVFVMYLRLVLWPWPLMIHYEFPRLEPLSAIWMYVLAAGMFIVGTLVLLWRRSAAGFVGAAVLAILAPTHLVPIVTEIAAERRMYLPLAALVSLAVVGGYSVWQRWVPPASNVCPNANQQRKPIVLVTAVALLALIYALVTTHRLAAYSDRLLLWQQIVDHQPYNHVAQDSLAVALSAAGRSQEAIEHYREALRLKPNYIQARYNLGLLLAADHRYDEAITELEAVALATPNAYKIHNNLGVIYFSAGRLPEAIEQFRRTLELKPDLTDAQENLERALKQSHATAPQQ